VSDKFMPGIPAGATSTGSATGSLCRGGSRCARTDDCRPAGKEGDGRLASSPSEETPGRGVTILFGGFTWKHHRLLQGVLHALGYRSEVLPDPDLESLQIGKECGNTGQCNPTYFTVGSLIKYLRELENRGFSRLEIIQQHVFITAGACGPCRFGMYEAEYDLALKNAGFEGFRVQVFHQKAGLSQGGDGSGMQYDEDFFLGLLLTMIIADQINDLAYQTRPYEVVAGETDRALKACIDRLYWFFAEDNGTGAVRQWMRAIRRLAGSEKDERRIGYLRLLGCQRIARELRSAAEIFRTIEVDYMRVRPIVKVTGEFWAQTTEGDGNFEMFRYLEAERAQVRTEPIAAWITYLLHQARQWHRERLFLPSRPELDRVVGRSPAGGFFARTARNCRRRLSLGLAEWLFKREWLRFRRALRGIPNVLVDQRELERFGHAYYHPRARGGEGHLEVAENIYFSSRNLAHMVLSLKPFGCMPSTQSDGVQSAVISRFPDMIFLPIETSGEGKVNAQSRVQMALSEAREVARREYEDLLSECVHTEEQIRAYVKTRPELRHGMLNLPEGKAAGTAARFVLHVDALMLGERSASRTTRSGSAHGASS